MRIHIIRHGITDAIENGIYASVTQMSVNQNGIDRLTENAADGIYPVPTANTLFVASNLERTSQTLEVLYGAATDAAGNPICLSIMTLGLFDEMDCGIYEGKGLKDLAADEWHTAWVKNLETARPPKGESAERVWKRYKEGFEKLHAFSAEDADVILASHGLAMGSVLNRLFGTKILDAVAQPGEGFTLELAFDAEGKLVPEQCRYLGKIHNPKRDDAVWKAPEVD